MPYAYPPWDKFVPPPYDEEAIARYAGEREEGSDPEWRRRWADDGAKPQDFSRFTQLRCQFPRSRVRQLSDMARALDVSKESLIRRIIAEFMIANLDEPRADIEKDFPVFRAQRHRPYDHPSGERIRDVGDG